MANLYYREDLTPESLTVGAVVEVLGDEARHAVRVSRLRTGERIFVGNGAGIVGSGAVETAAKDRFTVRIDHVEHTSESEPRVVLVQALAKGDRDERAVEQSTEFGVDIVRPWESVRSVSRWSGKFGDTEKATRGVEKWQRIAREASKQSLRSRTTDVRAPITLAELQTLASVNDSAVLVLHPLGTRSLSNWTASEMNSSLREILLVVGPEGGITDNELDTLESAGAEILSLGSTVLRTSSAGPAALAVLNVALGRW